MNSHHIKFMLTLLTVLLFGTTSTMGQAIGAAFSERGDSVEIRGAEFGELLGTNLSQLSLLAVGVDGQPHEVCFQIDERQQSGDVILKGTKLPGVNLLSVEDEVVFMARHVGQKMTDSQIPSGTRLVKEIEVLDPQSGEKRFVYLLAQEIPQIAACSPAVQYNEEERNAYGSNYFASYDYSARRSERAFWQINHLSLAWQPENLINRTDGTTQLSANVIDREFLDVQLASLGGFVQWKMDLNDLNAKEVGFVHGPVRTVRKIRLHPNIGAGLLVKPVTLLQIFYDQFIVTRISAELNPYISSMFSKISLDFGSRLTSDFQYEQNRYVYSPAKDKIEPGRQVHVAVLKVRPPSKNPQTSVRPATEALALIAIRGDDDVTQAIEALDLPENPDAPTSGAIAAEPPDSKTLAFRMDVKKFDSGPFTFEILQIFPNSEAQLQNFIKQLEHPPLKYRVSTFKQNIVMDLH